MPLPIAELAAGEIGIVEDGVESLSLVVVDVVVVLVVVLVVLVVLVLVVGGGGGGGVAAVTCDVGSDVAYVEPFLFEATTANRFSSRNARWSGVSSARVMHSS